MIRTVLLVIMIIVPIALVAVILLQQRGSGVGTVFGGGGGEAYRSRRGAEKLLHYATIFLAFLFASVSVVLLLI